MVKTFTQNESTEAVGYARPPKDTRFKKGKSGNPGGRPKAANSPQKMTQAILQTPLQSRKGRKLNRTQQDQIMLQIAMNAVTSVKAARLIFGIAYPHQKTKIPRIPNEVLADLHELRALQEWDLPVSSTDTADEAQLKYSLAVKAGHVKARIERAIAHIPLALEEDDD